MGFDDIVEAWQHASVDDIHPLRADHVDAYWQTGRVQARQVADYTPDEGLVVDFGCGEGRLSVPLAVAEFRVVAVDSSKTMLGRVRRQARKAGVKVRCVESDGRGLSGKVTDVDTVVARAVLIHHSHTDAGMLVAELAGCLRMGGHLVADWPVGDHSEAVAWNRVTTWDPAIRGQVADRVGLSLVAEGDPARGQASVWVKTLMLD